MEPNLFELSPGADSTVPTEIDVAHLDFSYIEKCTSASELLNLQRELRTGKHGLYPALEVAIETRLLATMSDVDRRRYLTLKGPTRVEEDEAKDGVKAWMSSMASLEAATKKEVAAAGVEKVTTLLPPVRGTPRGALGMGSSSSSSSKALQSMPETKQDVKTSVSVGKLDSKAQPFKEFYDRWDQFDVDAELSKAETQMAEEVRS